MKSITLHVMKTFLSILRTLVWFPLKINIHISTICIDFTFHLCHITSIKAFLNNFLSDLKTNHYLLLIVLQHLIIFQSVPFGIRDFSPSSLDHQVEWRSDLTRPSSRQLPWLNILIKLSVISLCKYISYCVEKEKLMICFPIQTIISRLFECFVF